ncbi:hypothetical protein [Sphingobium lactosutens]|jgi:hypothetical protein|uniref:hypothetical protein n=1 Tax=Sphingobium lactosutens TaxID=522773 RepID=UPI001D18AF47|nr:hypothetical protein [Sphingobium lactosutens]MCC4258051.1 hypothetical protein [Sphingobium lactosutens]
MGQIPEVEFDMPLQMEGHLAGDPQFEGMRRKFRISRAAMDKAVGQSLAGVSDQDLYDEFFFDIWMSIKQESWRKRPRDGVVQLDETDIDG